MIKNAFVNLWNKPVGAVAWNEETQTGNFEFEPNFLKGNLDLAPLKMPLAAAKGRIFSFQENNRSTTFKGLPGLLADTLPDRYGNALINVWLAKKGRAPDSMNPVEMLCFIGKRGMGALEFEPVVPKGADTSTKIDIDSLVCIAQEILSGRKQFTSKLSKHDEKALMDILKIGTSAGGARAKAVIAYNPKTGEVRSGQTDAPKGFSQWLIKLDGVKDNELGTSQGYGRVELAYHMMAKDCRIEMMESRLFEENGRAHFMTKRFDRLPGNEKVHVQSFCAMMQYDYHDIASYSYEQLFQTMRTLRLTHPEAEQMFRRMVFNVLARNCDDHTKNFAFEMDTTGEWKLTPAFDICHAYRPGSAWVSRQSLSVNGKRENITRNDLLEVARQISLKKGAVIIDQISGTVKKWNQYAEQTKVESKLRGAIKKTLLLL